MSPFNQCLVLCQTGPAKEYFRLIYWTRNSRNRDSKDLKRIKACALRETLSQEEIDMAHAAKNLWNELKPRAKLLIPQPTQFDKQTMEAREKRIRSRLSGIPEETIQKCIDS